MNKYTDSTWPSRRDLLKATAVVAPLAIFSRSASAQARPNFVFIMADDLGYADVSCYGRREYTTPNIDSLARDGMKLTHAYANSALCSPTRVALITGRYQYRVQAGLYQPIGGGAIGLPPGHPTLPSVLKEAGYGTTLLGKWHIGQVPEFGPTKYGYDHFWGFAHGALSYFTHSYTGDEGLYEDEVRVEENGYLTDLIGNRAVEHIRDYAGSKTPFLLSVHFNAPHWPWEGPETGPLTLPGGGAALGSFETGDLATYGAMVTSMDAAIGRILQVLEQDEFSKNTVVVFTSDNGGERFSDTWPFTGKKTELLEGGLRIPAIARWPGHIQPGSVSEQVAMSMDWMPTFVSMAGASTHSEVPPDGMNLTAALIGAAPVSRKVFWSYRQNDQHAMRDGNMKWLSINDNQFLFDVVKDPLERANLRRLQPDVFERMAREWDEWNAQMLDGSEIPNSYHFNSSQLADHYAPQDAGAKGKAKAKGKGKGKGDKQ